MENVADPIALDIHTHLIPIDTGRLAGCTGIAWDAAAELLAVDGHEVGIKALFHPEKLVAWMDANTVAHAYISAPPPTYRQHLRGEEARDWCDYLNHGLREIAQSHPRRLTPLLHLPTQDPAIACDIVRAAGAQGQRHFAMPTGTGDERTLAMAEFAPLWAALDAIGAFVFFHPGECADGRLSAFYLGNLLGNPYESTVALVHLILGGVLEAHPSIVPCFAHGGGLLPMVAGRLQRGYDTQRPGVDTAALPPKALLGRIYADCICHGEAGLTAAEETFGKDRVLFGSDWPFPMGLVEPHAQLAEQPAERKRRIFTDNPAKLPAHLAPRA